MPNKMRKNKEEILQKQVIAYIRQVLPKPYYLVVNPYAGMKMSVSAAAKAKVLGLESAQPDVMIFKRTQDGYNGLFLELKAEGVVIFNKDGSLRKSDHLYRQAQFLDYAKNEMGAATYFAVGFEEAKRLIDLHYLNS